MTGGSAAVVIANVPAVPMVKVVEVALVNVGVALMLLMMSVKFCVAVPLLLVAEKVSGWLPAVPGSGVPASVAVPLPLLVKVRPAGSVPVTADRARRRRARRRHGERPGRADDEGRGARARDRRRAAADGVHGEREVLRADADAVAGAEDQRIRALAAGIGRADQRRGAVAVVGERDAARQRAAVRDRSWPWESADVVTVKLPIAPTVNVAAFGLVMIGVLRIDDA